MDAITSAIVAALASLAQPVVRDAYNGLKDLIKKKYGQDGRIMGSLNSLEAKPASENRAAVVAEDVAEKGLEKDDEVLAAARKLLELVRSVANDQRGSQTVTQVVSGDKHIFTGQGDIHIDHRK